MSMTCGCSAWSFSETFYQDGGKPFRPLAINTKYVDIKEEN